MNIEKLSNYIPINRKLFSHPLWMEERPFSKFEAWIDLIQSARFEDGEAAALIGGKLIRWNRGELPVSLRYQGEKWKWSKNKVDDFFRMLESEKMIHKRTQKGTSQTIITLCNYKSYNINRKSEGQQKGQSRDSEGTAEGQRGDKYNKENKGKKEEEGVPTSQAGVDLRASNLFRQPHVPTWEEVLRVFLQQGGTEEMARKFFDNNEGVGWFYKGSPMTRYVNFVGPFITSWQKNEARFKTIPEQKGQKRIELTDD
jgi:hypothetical protein